MKLIVFLGNPGSTYKSTRHNAGFLFADFLKHKFDGEKWKNENKFNAEMSMIFLRKRKVILLKPQTFMNLSGESVIKVVNFFNIETENIIVVHDDKDLKFGIIRFKKNGSSGGHRGVASIINHLGTQEFSRIKIGVEAREENAQISTADFVLSRFKEDEIEQLNKEIFSEVETKLIEWLEK